MKLSSAYWWVVWNSVAHRFQLEVNPGDDHTLWVLSDRPYELVDAKKIVDELNNSQK